MSKVSDTKNREAVSRSGIGVTWFLKRTILAVVILCVSIGGIAWLLHASIDPTLEANAAEQGTAMQFTGSVTQR